MLRERLSKNIVPTFLFHVIYSAYGYTEREPITTVTFTNYDQFNNNIWASADLRQAPYIFDVGDVFVVREYS